jgi:ABC-type cobalamin/Fe3+-siderophores transport system ATPase subunit
MLTIESLYVAYGEKVVLHDFSLKLAPGEIVALIGPNGAGKSTLIRAISGVIKIQSGRVAYNGQDLTELSPTERARILGVVPQARQLGGAFTVEQTVLLGRTAYMNWLGQAQEEDRAQVREAMINTKTEHLAQRRIAELSGGEQQRVLLARTLAQTTPVLLMDEPTTHLDLKHQASLLALVRDLAKESNLAILMALHDLNQVSLYADRVALLVEGRLIAVGTPEEVLTIERISEAYQTPVQIVPHPESGTPLIFPEK